VVVVLVTGAPPETGVIAKADVKGRPAFVAQKFKVPEKVPDTVTTASVLS
jgi:hypothetical protein